MIKKIDKYFLQLSKLLKILNLDFLYTIPSIFKIKGRIDTLPSKLDRIRISTLNHSDVCVQDIKKVRNSKFFFISHYLGHHKDKNKDFYYDDLFKKLKKSKIDFSIILLNKTKKNPKDIIASYNKSKLSRIVINNYYSPLKNISSYFIIIINFFFYKFLLHSKIKRRDKFNNKYLNVKSFLESRNTYLLFQNLKKIISKSKKLKKLVLTYEGHSFEKILIKYLKSRNIKAYGYYFSVLRKYNTSVYYDFGNDTTPDKIMVTGDVIKKNFEKRFKKKPANLVIENIGYTRNIKKKNISQKKIGKNILVCPEGLVSETNYMLNFALNLKRKYADYNVVARLHPEVNKDLYLGKISKKKISISEKSIDEDLENSDILLYRGTSLCINALYKNTLPVYLNSNRELNIDPLYEINNLSISKTSEFRKINKILSNNKIFNQHITKLKNYSDMYFEKFKYSYFKKKLIS